MATSTLSVANKPSGYPWNNMKYSNGVTQGTKGTPVMGVNDPKLLGGAYSAVENPYKYYYARAQPNNTKYDPGTWLIQRYGGGFSPNRPESAKFTTMPASWDPNNNNPWSFKSTIGSDSSRQGTYSMGIGQGGGGAVQTSYNSGQFFDPRTGFNNAKTIMPPGGQFSTSGRVKKMSQYRNLLQSFYNRGQ
jgi:hypothetical protein